MKKTLSVLMVLLLAASVVFAGGSKDKKTASTTVKGAAAGYTYGAEKTFHSDDPVTYSMFFSDASWYPMVDTWKTEGVWKKIEERTNVKLDLTSYDSGDYTNKITLDINAGASRYIIPKVYDENPFVSGGAIVPISDWVQYMPNYSAYVEKYNFAKDLEVITKDNGKYYRLPGMNEKSLQDYTLLIRKDLFDAAGYNIKELEKNWTWEDLYNILVGVKAYMVKNGLAKENQYIWSDLWCGATSGKGQGGSLLKIMGGSYGVPAGWAIGDAIDFDFNKNEWYFSSITPEYKAFVTMANKFVKGGILDPETFTQDDQTAMNKFYNGETVIISMNRGQYATEISGLDTGLGKGNYEAYVTVYPCGTTKYTSENQRLENGVMIAQKALDELGEEGFIKMLRFVDWLWYSKEGYELIKWGPEGETFQYVTDAKTGLKIKSLLPGYKCSGLGISGGENDVDIRLKWGYAGGNIWYGHTTAECSDNFIPVIQDYYARLGKYRAQKPIKPGNSGTEDEIEQTNLWRTPLIDNVNAWTLQFITGQKDINKDWDTYVASCKNKNCDKLIDLTNTIYKRNTAKNK